MKSQNNAANIRRKGATMKNKEEKFLPEGYRYLDLGEEIKPKDYFWNEDDGKWMKILHGADTAVWVEEQVIRKHRGQ